MGVDKDWDAGGRGPNSRSGSCFPGWQLTAVKTHKMDTLSELVVQRAIRRIRRRERWEESGRRDWRATAGQGELRKVVDGDDGEFLLKGRVERGREGVWAL